MTTAARGVRVLGSPADVAAALSPLRLRLLEQLVKPDSATGLARRLELPRQKVNYHLRELEKHGLVELVEERQRRGCVERRLRVSARALLVDPELLGSAAGEPDAERDRFSSAFQVSRAARLVREVATLRARAQAAQQRLLTLTLESEVSFASVGELREFAEELSNEVARLIAKYHRPRAGARAFRFLLAAHPRPKADAPPHPDLRARNDAEPARSTPRRRRRRQREDEP